MVAQLISPQTIFVFISLLLGITIILSVADILLGGHGQSLLMINRGNDLEKEFPVSGKGRGTLLDALSENKIFIPSACGGKGTCGHCKVKVENGGGAILPTEENFLSFEEKKDGVRLACQLKVREDIDINLPGGLLEAQEYTAEVVALEGLTYDIKLLKLKLLVPETIDFKPGQYVQILVPGYEEFRAYSIASPPSQKDAVEYNIRYQDKGMCTTYIHKALEHGDRVKLTGPYGDFFLREDSDRDIICIGGGAGMAPLRSMVYHLKEQGMPRNTRFYFGARTEDDLFYVRDMRNIEEKYPNFKFYIALSEPQQQNDWEGETGFITDVVKKYEGSLEDAEGYLCGPPPMLDAAISVLTEKGMPEEQILLDKF